MEIAARAAEALGTVVEIKLPAQQSFLFPACFSEMKRIEGKYSRFIASSQLSQLNANLGKWNEADEELLFLLEKAEEFRKRTDGFFDICVKEALDAIGYDSSYFFVPKEKKESIASLLLRMLPAISISKAKKRVLLRRQVDFGGFGKGYAIDCVASLLEKMGVKHYCINAGGDIYARRHGEPAWEILLEHPDDPSRAIGKIELDGRAIAASAPNRRKWGQGKFHHLINPKTGKPAGEAKCIFAIAKTAMEADAYATALFAAGFERAIELSRSLPVEILIVSAKNKMYQSDGFGAEIFH